MRRACGRADFVSRCETPSTQPHARHAVLRPVPLVSIPFEVRSPTGRAPESGASPPPRPTTARSGGTAAVWGPQFAVDTTLVVTSVTKDASVVCHTYVTLSSLLMVLSHGSTDTLGGAIAPFLFCVLHPSGRPRSVALVHPPLGEFGIPNISKRKDRERARERGCLGRGAGRTEVHKGGESSSSTRAGWTGASKKSRDRGRRATEPAGWVGDQNITCVCVCLVFTQNWRELSSF